MAQKTQPNSGFYFGPLSGSVNTLVPHQNNFVCNEAIILRMMAPSRTNIICLRWSPPNYSTHNIRQVFLTNCWYLKNQIKSFKHFNGDESKTTTLIRRFLVSARCLVYSHGPVCVCNHAPDWNAVRCTPRRRPSPFAAIGYIISTHLSSTPLPSGLSNAAEI